MKYQYVDVLGSNPQTLVNSCYCLLILVGKLIQNVVFGELRVIEQQVSCLVVFFVFVFGYP